MPTSITSTSGDRRPLLQASNDLDAEAVVAAQHVAEPGDERAHGQRPSAGSTPTATRTSSPSTATGTTARCSAAAIEPLAGPHVVAAPVPGASQLGAVQRPEVKGQRRVAAPVEHRVDLAVHVHDEDRLPLDIDRVHRGRAGRPPRHRRADTPAAGPIVARPPGSAPDRPGRDPRARAPGTRSAPSGAPPPGRVAPPRASARRPGARGAGHRRRRRPPRRARRRSRDRGDGRAPHRAPLPRPAAGPPPGARRTSGAGGWPDRRPAD